MHPRLVTPQLEVPGAPFENHRTVFLDWIDTAENHMYLLYFMTGKTDYLAVLQVIDRLRDEASKAGTLSQIPHPVLLELARELNSLGGDVPARVANGRALLINDYAASPLQARPPSLVAGVKRAA